MGFWSELLRYVVITCISHLGQSFVEKTWKKLLFIILTVFPAMYIVHFHYYLILSIIIIYVSTFCSQQIPMGMSIFNKKHCYDDCVEDAVEIYHK